MNYNAELPATIRTTDACTLIWKDVFSVSTPPSPTTTENVSLTALMDFSTTEKDFATLALLNAEPALDLKTEIALLAS
jgi:hypothetical protein